MVTIDQAMRGAAKCVRQCENVSDITTHKNPESVGM